MVVVVEDVEVVYTSYAVVVVAKLSSLMTGSVVVVVEEVDVV